jgi:hypothetical protein
MATPIVNNLNSLQDNPTFQKTPFSAKFYTSKLLNWVEPIEISGKLKTAFYSELNNNFNIGDRVFILNGNYDSDEFISANKYSKFSDGYRVLGRDGTRIILDIDYSGILPYIVNGKDDSIRIQNVRTQREFDYINSLRIATNAMSIINDSGNTIQISNSRELNFKFSGELRRLGSTTNQTVVLYTNSLIYAESAFLGSSDIYNQNNGVSGSGFYIKVGNSWQNVDTEFLAGRIKNATGNYSQNNKIFVVGEDIDSSEYYFRQRNSYHFINNIWEIDIKSKQPYISKLNFRHGKFNGKHNDGIFGTSKVRNKWKSAEWNSGAFLNSEWYSGSMNSKSTPGEKSFYSVLTSTSSRPTETIDFTNNRGFGYNLIEDSNFVIGNLLNGNFNNCNIGYTSTFSSTDIYFNSSGSFDMKLNGKFELCNIYSVSSEFSTIINSNINNSILKDSTIINSQLSNTVANNSTISDKNSIKVVASDLWSYALQPTIKGVIKLFISDSDLDKINLGESFYLYRTGKEYFLNLLSEDQKILLPVETKYLLDLYFDSEIDTKILVSLKTRDDNRLRTFAATNTAPPSRPSFSTIFEENNNSYASIDIESEKFAIYDENLITGSTRKVKYTDYILDPIDTTNINQFFKDVEISNSDFKSGYFNNSTWLNSANINYNHHRIKKDNFNLEISYYTNDTIKILLDLNQYNANEEIPEEDLFEGDIVWLNSITQIDSATTNKKEISGRFKVVQINTLPFEKEILLVAQEDQTFFVSNDFRVENAEFSNYLSINKFRIENSTINKGFFRRTSITNSSFTNVDFNNQDRDLTQSNIKQLKLINIIFKDTLNKINAGLLYKSHFVNDTWNNGLVFNSIWNNGLFKNGVFNNSYWQNGTFDGGVFINSRELTQTNQDYNTEPVYKNWLDGTFNSGEFWNSYWMKGTFNNGRFYNSDWYSGIWNNGILGSNTIPYNETKMGVNAPISISTQSTIWNNGVVENALIGGEGKVNWYGGKFLNGEMTDNQSISSSTIWYDGDFLGGKITGYVSWKNGNFYKGKFASILGWNLHTPTFALPISGRWGWENGKFHGGEFGNGTTGTNSVWLNGEFKGGIFMGRYWRYGIFSKGEFQGSLTSSIYDSPKSSTVDFNAVNSFSSTTSPYYGFWRDGIVSDSPESVVELLTAPVEVKRKSDIRREDNRVVFKNMLWLGGTFSHKNATLQSSIWLNGNFYDGTFDSGIFNAFADRQFTGSLGNSSFATSSSVWHNGKFDSTVGTGSFYVSEWKKGTFEKGYMSGAIWKDGIWNYGTAENIYWENGLWRNGNWNGAPFNYSDMDDFRVAPFTVSNPRTKDIILHIGNTLGTDELYLINVFSASSFPEILPGTDVPTQNGPTSSFIWDIGTEVYFSQQGTIPGRPNSVGLGLGPNNLGTTYSCSEWLDGTTFSLDGIITTTNSHVYTFGGQPENSGVLTPGYNSTDTRNGYNIPESHTLYAQVSQNDRNVFTHSGASYEIRINLTVELASEVIVDFNIGSGSTIRHSFASNAQVSVDRYDYWAKQYDILFIYNTPDGTLTQQDKQFSIKKRGIGLLRILEASIIRKKTEYHPVYNNTLFGAINGNTVVLPNDSTISTIGSSDTGRNVSINFGNGLFRSGVWENGVWNNGLRSNLLINEPDYYKFSDIVGFNGLRPFGGKNSYQVDGNNWLVTIKGIDSVAGLNTSDRISIGNIVLIDINEKRKLVKDYFKISSVDFANNTITVNIITDFPIRRVEKDSENHLIYVSKNIWLTGAFLNGYFRGIWNNGLFKGAPYITTMEASNWIDGKFDGGRFISRGVTESSLNLAYNNGLIQKFNFLDNNVGSSAPKYISWIDVNYDQYSYTQLNTDATLFEEFEYYNTQDFYVQPDPGVPTSFPYYNNQSSKQGTITYDILESLSSFKDNSNNDKLYNLGSKFNKYENFIPEDGKFLEPLSNNLGTGTNLDNLFDNGWTYSDFSNGVTFNSLTSGLEETIIFPSSPIRFSSNVDGLNSNKLQIFSDNTSPNVIIFNYSPTDLIHLRYSGVVLNNSNIVTERNRYYITQLDLSRISTTNAIYTQTPYASTPTGTLATQSSSISLELIEGINELNNPNLVKTQYFFNRRDLNLAIRSISSARYINAQPMSAVGFLRPPNPDNKFDITFNNISFVEVDMIPFFKYYRNDEIDQKVKTPYFAVAPFIDYTNANFDFIGNVTITIDSDTIVGQNISTVIIGSGGVNGSISNTTGGLVTGLAQAVPPRNSGSLFP